MEKKAKEAADEDGDGMRGDGDEDGEEKARLVSSQKTRHAAKAHCFAFGSPQKRAMIRSRLDDGRVLMLERGLPSGCLCN